MNNPHLSGVVAEIEARRIADASTCRPGRAFDVRSVLALAVTTDGATGVVHADPWDGSWVVKSVPCPAEGGPCWLTLTLWGARPRHVVVTTPDHDAATPMSRAAVAVACSWCDRHGLVPVVITREKLADVEFALAAHGLDFRPKLPTALGWPETHAIRVVAVLSALGRREAGDIATPFGKILADRSDPLRHDRRAAELREVADRLTARDAVADARRASGEVPGAAHQYGPHSVEILAREMGA